MSYGQQGHMWAFQFHFLPVFFSFSVPRPLSCFSLELTTNYSSSGSFPWYDHIALIAVSLDSILASSLTNTGFLLTCQLTGDGALAPTVWRSIWTFLPHVHLSTHLPYVTFLCGIYHLYFYTYLFPLSLITVGLWRQDFFCWLLCP